MFLKIESTSLPQSHNLSVKYVEILRFCEVVITQQDMAAAEKISQLLVGLLFLASSFDDPDWTNSTFLKCQTQFCLHLIKNRHQGFRTHYSLIEYAVNLLIHLWHSSLTAMSFVNTFLIKLCFLCCLFICFFFCEVWQGGSTWLLLQCNQQLQ